MSREGEKDLAGVLFFLFVRGVYKNDWRSSGKENEPLTLLLLLPPSPTAINSAAHGDNTFDDDASITLHATY